MDEESSESTKEEVTGAGIGESEIEKLRIGWRRNTGSWLQRQGEAKRKKRHKFFATSMMLVAKKRRQEIKSESASVARDVEQR